MDYKTLIVNMAMIDFCWRCFKRVGRWSQTVYFSMATSLEISF